MDQKTNRIGVLIATPKRHYAGPQDLPKAVGRALHELATRGQAKEEADEAPSAADIRFRAEADKYAFEFAIAVGSHSRARNALVHEFLKSDCQFLLWVDDDLDSDPRDNQGTLADVILRLLSHRQPVVGALYCKRAKRPQWVCSWLPESTLADDTKGELLQVLELGTGCKLYHRKVFTELRRIFGEEPDAATPKGKSIFYRDRDSGETIAGFFQNCVIDGDLLSEDYYLDLLCRFTRIPILVDTKIKLRHRAADGTVYPPDEFPPIPADGETAT